MVHPPFPLWRLSTLPSQESTRGCSRRKVVREVNTLQQDPSEVQPRLEGSEGRGSGRADSTIAWRAEDVGPGGMP